MLTEVLKKCRLSSPNPFCRLSLCLFEADMRIRMNAPSFQIRRFILSFIYSNLKKETRRQEKKEGEISQRIKRYNKLF